MATRNSLGILQPDRHGELPTEGGRILYAIFGPVTCKKYVGRFLVESLQAKADTELWYTEIQGNPGMPRGEGHTPEFAMKDSLQRAQDLAAKLQHGMQTIHNQLGEET